jgi:hypothetical protein
LQLRRSQAGGECEEYTQQESGRNWIGGRQMKNMRKARHNKAANRQEKGGRR